MLLLAPTQRAFVRAFVAPTVNRAIRTRTPRRHVTGARHLSVSSESNYKAPLSKFAPLDQTYNLVSPAADFIPLKDKQRLVCFGDVHGDLHALETFLRVAQVYENGEWVGGNTILVQCGDILDRGSEELACFSMLTKLSQQAQAAGGAVIVLWGNHEALNAAGLFQYATDDVEYEQQLGTYLDDKLQTERWRIQFAGNQPSRWAAYEPGGLLAKRLMANMKVAVKVGRTVCVHAGLTAKHLDDYGGLPGINQKAQDWAREGKGKNGCFPVL